MDNINIDIIESAIFLALLFRTCITDLKSRIIENHIVIMIFVNNIVWNIIKFKNVPSTEILISSIVIHLMIGILLFIFYNIKNIRIGAGDIKLLCASELYFENDDIVWWLIIMGVVIICYHLLNKFFIRNGKDNFPLAPFVFSSTVCLFLNKGIYYIFD